MALLCARIPADKVDYENERFVVCKSTGVNAYGVKYEMGDELPHGVLNARALREIYDTPLRLIETMDYALADDQLLAAMLARPTSEPDPQEVLGNQSQTPPAESVKAPQTRGQKTKR